MSATQHSALYTEIFDTPGSELHADEKIGEYLNNQPLPYYSESGPMNPASPINSDAYTQLSDVLQEANEAEMGIVAELSKDKQGNWVWIRDATQQTEGDRQNDPESLTIQGRNLLLRGLSCVRAIDYAIAKEGGSDVKGRREVLRDALLTYTTQIEGYVRELKNTHFNLKGQFTQLNQLKAQLTTLGKEKAQERTELKEQIKTLEKALLKNKVTDEIAAIEQNLAGLEEQFNNQLVRLLHDNNLTRGCKKEKDAMKLLFRYRELSAVLIPSRTVITITKDVTTKSTNPKLLKVANVYTIEKQTPVTHKTEAQKQEMVTAIVRGKTKPYLRRAVENFKDLLMSDRTALGAQARKWMPFGAKNAYITRIQAVALSPSPKDDIKASSPQERLAALEQKPQLETVHIFARMGSPGFMGKGLSKEARIEYTKQNLEQIQEEVRRVYPEVLAEGICSACLNTETIRGNEKQIVQSLRGALKKLDSPQARYLMALTSVNQQAGHKVPAYLQLYPVQVPEEIVANLSPENKKDYEKNYRGKVLSRQQRLELALLIALPNPHERKLFIVNCASGQDRTGTFCEGLKRKVLKAWYKERGLNSDNVDKISASSGATAAIATARLPGSTGLKKDSWIEGLFTKFEDKFLYLKSAKTNKAAAVGDVSFLKKPSEDAVLLFKAAFDQLGDQIADLEEGSPLRTVWAQLVELETAAYLKGYKVRQLIVLHDLVIGLLKVVQEPHSENPSFIIHHFAPLAQLVKESSSLFKNAKQKKCLKLLGKSFSEQSRQAIRAFMEKVKFEKNSTLQKLWQQCSHIEKQLALRGYKSKELSAMHDMMVSLSELRNEGSLLSKEGVRKLAQLAQQVFDSASLFEGRKMKDFEARHFKFQSSKQEWWTSLGFTLMNCANKEIEHIHELFKPAYDSLTAKDDKKLKQKTDALTDIRQTLEFINEVRGYRRWVAPPDWVPFQFGDDKKDLGPDTIMECLDIVSLCHDVAGIRAENVTPQQSASLAKMADVAEKLLSEKSSMFAFGFKESNMKRERKKLGQALLHFAKITAQELGLSESTGINKKTREFSTSVLIASLRNMPIISPSSGLDKELNPISGFESSNQKRRQVRDVIMQQRNPGPTQNGGKDVAPEV